jgi:hypothetical protein
MASDWNNRASAIQPPLFSYCSGSSLRNTGRYSDREFSGEGREKAGRSMPKKPKLPHEKRFDSCLIRRILSDTTSVFRNAQEIIKAYLGELIRIVKNTRS